MTKTRLLIALLGILVFLGVVFLILRHSPPVDQPGVPRGSFSPEPRSGPSQETVLFEQLTVAERSYPTAPPQSFPQSSSSLTGGLVVTTNPNEARILIDAAESEEGEAPIETGAYSPPATKLSPFTFLDIPEGRHVLSVFKKGYLEEKVEFVVKPGEITRLEIPLVPLTETSR